MSQPEAGWELDAEVAEKVMGVDMPRSFPEAYPPQLRVDPPYSTDIEMAWYVVERMREQGWGFQLTNATNDGTDDWSVEYWPLTGGDTVLSHADTAPLCICLAALSALRSLEENQK